MNLDCDFPGFLNVPRVSTAPRRMSLISILGLAALASCDALTVSCSANDSACDGRGMLLYALARPPSGTFDVRFGVNGRVGLDTLAGAANSYDRAAGLTLDSQGRLHVTGITHDLVPLRYMFDCRLDDSGAVDASFAPGSSRPGCALINSGVNDDHNGGVTLDGAGRPLLVGTSNVSMQARRLTPDGLADGAFNGSGFVTHALGVPTGEGQGVVADASDRIYISGRSNCAANCDWTVWRYTPAGALDPAWNGVGYIQTAGGYATAMDVMLDSSGRVVSAGFANTVMEVRRYNPDGSLDLSFSGDGIYSFPAAGFISSGGARLALDRAGNIFISGAVTVSTTPFRTDMAVWRLTPDGTLDTTFNGGYITHQNAAGGADVVDDGLAVAVDEFNRVVVAGVSCNNAGYSDCLGPDRKGFSIVVWRYNANGSPDLSFNGGAHFKILDDNIFYQNSYAMKIGLKIDGLRRIIVSAGRDNDAPAGGDGHAITVYRIWG